MIKSAIEIVNTPKFQCSSCSVKNTFAARERHLNCTGTARTDFKKKSDGFTYTRCPGNFYNPGYARLLDVHAMFRKGVMSYPGGLMDQPAKFIDAMNLIENLVSTVEVANLRKNQMKGARNGVRK